MARVLRPPQIDLATVLTEPNPQIDLRLEAYESSTRNFLKAVGNYKNRAVTTISTRRANQAAERKKVLEKTQAVESETIQCKLKEIELVADLEREKEDRKDAELSVAAFKRQLAALKEKCSSIESEIEQYRAVAANLRREKNKERSTLDTQSSRMSPELSVLEQWLSCVVEGIKKDQLLVRFHQVDPSDSNREFSFVIDVSDRIYKVLTTSPPLPSLAMLVETLNDTRDIYGFIKQVRVAYAAQVKPIL